MSKINQKQTLAKKYASSLFEYVMVNVNNTGGAIDFPFAVQGRGDSKDLFTVFENIRLLQYLILANTKLQDILLSPNYTSMFKVDLLNSILPSSSAILKAFLQILAERNQLSILLDILTEYQSIYNQYIGMNYVKVISRVPLSKENKSTLRSFLSKKYSKDVNQPKIFLDFIISDKILGGLVLVDGFSRLDISLKHKVQELLKTL